MTNHPPTEDLSTTVKTLAETFGITAAEATEKMNSIVDQARAQGYDNESLGTFINEFNMMLLIIRNDAYFNPSKFKRIVTQIRNFVRGVILR